MTDGPTKRSKRNIKSNYFQKEKTLKVVLQARWLPKSDQNDRYLKLMIVETHVQNIISLSVNFIKLNLENRPTCVCFNTFWCQKSLSHHPVFGEITLVIVASCNKYSMEKLVSDRLVTGQNLSRLLARIFALIPTSNRLEIYDVWYSLNFKRITSKCVATQI